MNGFITSIDGEPGHGCLTFDPKKPGSEETKATRQIGYPGYPGRFPNGFILQWLIV
jgi:hypothetical protein